MEDMLLCETWLALWYFNWWSLSKLNINLLFFECISLGGNVPGGINNIEDSCVPLESSLFHELFLGKVSSLKGSKTLSGLEVELDHVGFNKLAGINFA